MEEPAVAVGRITGAHGTRGEVSVLVLSEVEERFADGAELFLEDGRRLTVSSSRPHRGRLLVRFQEVPDRTAAEVLVRGILFVPESMSPPLPEGSWWDHQLVGCRVEVEGGRSLGELRDVIHTPANDVWSVVDAEDAETLIPVLRDVIASVDVKAKAIVVRAVPGLTVPEG